jgi:hypothetical protein
VVKNLAAIVGKYIKNTPRKGYVKDLRIKICDVPHKLKRKLKITDERVYITTKSLKHLYDVRPAGEFDFIISNIESFILSPTRVYKNKEGKTGDICFYKEVEGGAYFSILEMTGNSVCVVSAYRLSDIAEKRINYLAGYKLIWSWKVDLPSS